MTGIEESATSDSDKTLNSGARDLNIAARFERLPLTSYQRILFIIIATAWLFDSIDLAALTFVLAPLSDDFDMSTTQAGFVASISFVGMVIGATMAGALADRFGRRPVFTTSMICWGAASVLAAVSWDLSSLLVARLFIGIGMGAEFPVAQSLLSEFLPAKSRGKYLGFLEGFWPLGFIACGVLSVIFVPWLGWRSIFAIQAVVSLYALYIRRAVPESPRWYEAQGKVEQAEHAMADLEQKVEKAYKKPLPPVEDGIGDAPPRAVRLRELVSSAYRGRTFMMWALWFCALLGYYGITTWQGKLLADNGMTVSKSITFVLLMALWGIPGFLTSSLLLERLGRRPVVTGTIVLSAVMAYVYGSQTSTAGLIIAGSAMQFCFFAMWSALYAYTPEVFPTRFRATGCGTSSAVGRIGAMLGPILIPVALDVSGQDLAFLIMAAFMFLGAVIALVWGPETRGKVLEEVSG